MKQVNNTENTKYTDMRTERNRLNRTYSKLCKERAHFRIDEMMKEMESKSEDQLYYQATKNHKSRKRKTQPLIELENGWKKDNQYVITNELRRHFEAFFKGRPKNWEKIQRDH